MGIALFAKIQPYMHNIGSTLDHIRDTREMMPHLSQEVHLIVGKEVRIPPKTLMIIL